MPILKSVDALKNVEVHKQQYGIGDNSNFAEANIPAVLYIDYYMQLYPKYLSGDALAQYNKTIKVSAINSSRDTIDKVDFDVLAKKINFVLKAILGYAT